jgi:hypothetical protein
MTGLAFPPVRIVRVAQQLQAAGAGVTVQSICQASFTNALLEIIRQIKSALTAACLSRQLNLEADGSVNCDVVAVMPEAMPCDIYPGAVAQTDDLGAPIIEDGHNVCVLPQLVPDNRTIGAAAPPGTGWFYDSFTAESQMNCQKGTEPFQRIGFAGTQPPPGSTVRLQCFLPVSSTGTGVGIGTFCDPLANPDPVCPTANDPAGIAPLGCSIETRSCGVPCTQESGGDAVCRNAGLIGFVCDTRELGVVDPSKFPGNTTPYNFCVNPTCG